jgi:predicted pyridoxine 5'-phosphate oxidase superfamily flavin-nucleotide-binding protein
VDGAVPLLAVATHDASALAAQLAAGTPSIVCSLARRHEDVLLFSPVSLTADDARIIGERLRAI